VVRDATCDSRVKVVLRCVDAVRTSGIAASLDAIGLIDRDYSSSAFLGALPTVHEIESLFANTLHRTPPIRKSRLRPSFTSPSATDLPSRQHCGGTRNATLVLWPLWFESNSGLDGSIQLAAVRVHVHTGMETQNR
jgi:hypothetical protein